MTDITKQPHYNDERLGDVGDDMNQVYSISRDIEALNFYVSQRANFPGVKVNLPNCLASARSNELKSAQDVFVRELSDILDNYSLIWANQTIDELKKARNILVIEMLKTIKE